MTYVEESAITKGPTVNWKHIDGPMMVWAGLMHWLTWRERAAIWLGLTTVNRLAAERWPHLEQTCCEILIRKMTDRSLMKANER